METRLAFDPTKLKSQVETLLKRIPTMEDGAKLQNLLTNIGGRPELEDQDREALVDAVSRRIKVVSPKLAKEIFGPKDAQGKAFLDSLCAELHPPKFDLSNNRVGNGVKTGGFMIAGTKYVDVYISYKNAAGVNLSLAWIQDGPNDAPVIEMMKRHVRAPGDEPERTPFFDEQTAKLAYKEQLELLLRDE